MAHVKKFSKGSGGIGHLIAHFERRINENGEYVKFGNQDINLNKTHLNYNLAPYSLKPEEILKRCENHSKKKIRDNINIMCSWVITVPKDLDVKFHKDFFKFSYDFLEERYGKNNVISSFVHMDETTPHMHFAFIPITKDSRLSAKDVLNRQDLKTFHTDLQKFLEINLSHKVNIINQATELGNKEIRELKVYSALKQIKNLSYEIELKSDILSDLTEKNKNLINQIEKLNLEIEDLKLSKDKFISKREVELVKPTENLFLNFTNKVLIDKEEYKKIKNTAINVEKVQSDNLVLKNKMRSILGQLEVEKEELKQREQKLLIKEKEITEEIDKGIREGIQKQSWQKIVEENNLKLELEKFKKVVDAMNKILPENISKEIIQSVEKQSIKQGRSFRI